MYLHKQKEAKTQNSRTRLNNNQINKFSLCNMSGDLDHPHQLNNEIFTQEILIEAEDGVRYLVNLGGEECYENQVSNYEVNDCEKVHLTC